MGTPEYKLDALKEVSSQAKYDMVLLGSPLLLLLTQLPFLVSVNQTSIKLLATLAIAALFLGLLATWILWSFIAAWYAIELLCKEGRVETGLGAKFLSVVDSNGDRINEDGYLRCRAIFHPFIMICLVVGYLALAILLGCLIWS